MATEDEDKATFKNGIGTVQHSSCDGLNSSEATDVIVLSEEIANIPNINITNNFGSTVVCDNSEFSFNTKPLKTEVKAKKRNNESTIILPKRLTFDGKQLGDRQLKCGLANTCNRSEFCLEEAKDSEASSKVHTALYQCQLINIEDNSGIIIITTSTLGNQMTKRNINISNNFGIILVCDNTEILLNVQPNNTVERKQNGKESITADPKRIIFDGKRLRVGQSNTKYGLANTQNRSEFCLGQVVGLSTTEGEATFKTLNATCHQPVQIHNNSGIVIITACSQHHSNPSKASDVSAQSKEPTNIENIHITNNFGNTVVCDNSRVNIDLQSNDTIGTISIQDRKAVSLDQKLIFDGKEPDDGLSNIKNSLINRSEFCHS